MDNTRLTKTEEEESIIINRSARSTYPKRKSVSRGGATSLGRAETGSNSRTAHTDA